MDKKELQDFITTFKEHDDDDNCRIKEIIKERIVNNKFLIHFLDAVKLDEDSPDDYLGRVILPFYFIPDTQAEYKNMLCYETSWDGSSPSYGSEKMKYETITFYILCEQGNVIDTETGIPRHDLLAAIIKQEFSNTNIFGNRLMLDSDTPSTTDTHYATRTLKFVMASPIEGNIRTIDGVTKNVSNVVRR